MILLVVLEISASIAGYVKKDDVSKVLVNIAEDSMNNWNNTVVQSTWDQVQVKKITEIIYIKFFINRKLLLSTFLQSSNLLEVIKLNKLLKYKILSFRKQKNYLIQFLHFSTYF